MGLDDIVRSAVAIANTVTADLQVLVSHEAWTGQDTYAKPTYGAAVSRRAIVVRKRKLIRDDAGHERASSHSITFLGPVTIDPRDRLTLNDGTTGPILDVQGMQDAGAGGEYLTEVFL